MKTTFETAIDKHEIPDFFKGNGIYFARGSDWGDHLHINNWQEMCSVLKSQNAPQPLLTTLFEEYVNSLKEHYDDANGLLSNIISYYITRRRCPFLSSGEYDLMESLDRKCLSTTGRLFRLLRKVHGIKNNDLPTYSFEQQLQRLKTYGCNVDLESL